VGLPSALKVLGSNPSLAFVELPSGAKITIGTVILTRSAFGALLKGLKSSFWPDFFSSATSRHFVHEYQKNVKKKLFQVLKNYMGK